MSGQSKLKYEIKLSKLPLSPNLQFDAVFALRCADSERPQHLRVKMSLALCWKAICFTLKFEIGINISRKNLLFQRIPKSHTDSRSKLVLGKLL